MAKWVMLLSEFDIEYVNQKAIKGQVLADHLVETPLSENQPLITGFPDELVLSLDESPEWKIILMVPSPLVDRGQASFSLHHKGISSPKHLNQIPLHKQHC